MDFSSSARATASGGQERGTSARRVDARFGGGIGKFGEGNEGVGGVSEDHKADDVRRRHFGGGTMGPDERAATRWDFLSRSALEQSESLQTMDRPFGHPTRGVGGPRGRGSGSS